jgi:cytochrome c-type biogenesis protein CcmE
MKKGKRIGMIVGLIVVLSAFGYMLYGGIGENLVYFWTPGELLAKGNDAYDRPLRLGGLVMPGSHSWNADRLDLQFTLQDEGGSVRVHSRKAPPAMFREGQGVIVEGRMTREGVFEASSVMVKHSNEYRPPTDGHPKPEDMYKSLIRESN